MTTAMPTAAATTAAATTGTTSLPRTTVTVGLAGAVAATALAATAHAAGVPLEVDGQIPLLAFAQMTFLGALLGGGLAAVLRRRSTDPSRRFVQCAVVLTALSCVPSVALPADVATMVALVVIHLVAATIIVPVLARRIAA